MDFKSELIRRRPGRFLHREDAATAVEYAVLLALILLTAIGAIVVFGQAANQTWNNNNASLKAANFGS